MSPLIARVSALLCALLAACASPPEPAEEIWVTVAEIYTPETLQQPWNRPVAAHAQKAGFTQADISDGRVAKVACALGTSYEWASYAHLPAGLRVRREQVVRLVVVDPTTDARLGWNPVLGTVSGFDFPGSLRAYRFIPDWRERGLRSNLERIPLAPGQRGRYYESHSSYLIKCRQESPPGTSTR